MSKRGDKSLSAAVGGEGGQFSKPSNEILSLKKTQTNKKKVGDEVLELYHGKGETDDATWVYLPNRNVICTGDFFVWSAPNCGNKKKRERKLKNKSNV